MAVAKITYPVNPGLFSSSPIDKIDKSIENFEISLTQIMVI